VDKKDAFILALKENQGLIYKISSIYTRSDEDRRDLAQEILYQLWKSFDSFHHKSSVSTWIYRVAVNVSIHHIKIGKRKILTEPLNEEILDFHDIDHSEIEEKWKLFKQYIDQLNLLDKGIIILYLEDKSHEEIAQIIGISISNVGTRISRVKDKLRKQILKQQ
jgi:RNA polymerase sigma-70 factor (ECF subfamily)